MKAVLKTRCIPQGIELVFGDIAGFGPDNSFFGAILQYPDADGNIEDHSGKIAILQSKGLKVAVGADLLSLCLIKSPADMGADIAYGSSQRFGIPMGFGGPSAAYFATKEENKRSFPGRIIGVSKDKNGKTALRMALQMREQHIKREKATSNICTATALMATMSGFYAAYQ